MGSTRRQPRFGRLAGALLRTQPDERLLAIARGGIAAAFDELIRRHRPALTAYARSLSPSSRAEDVVQESLLKALVAIENGAEPEMFRAWLFRIVRNTAIDEQRVTRHHDQLDESYDGVEQPPQALERREMIGSLIVAIQDLPASQRQAIIQRELEGRGHEEIARAMKLSPGSVRQLIYRARHTLREAAGMLIPVAVLRAASVPGAGEVVGGAGAAVGLKLGLATVVATTTIVAGASIDRHGDQGAAEALQLPTRHHRSSAGAEDTSSGSLVARDRHDGGRSGSARSGKDSSREGEPSNDGPSGSGDGGGGWGHGGSGDGASGSSSGPGSGGSGGGSSSGSGSGVSGGGGSSGEGSGSDDSQVLTTPELSGSSDGPH